MLKLECPICLDFYPTDLFRLFHCGHGLCTGCLKKSMTIKNCNLCRAPKGEPIQIFTNFAEPSSMDEQASDVAGRLTQINFEAPAISVKKVGSKIRNLTKKAAINPARLEDLLKAAGAIEQRIFPIFSERDQLKEENASLQVQVVELSYKLAAKESLNIEVRRLERQLAEERAQSKAALQAEKNAKDRVLRGIEENERLKRHVERQRGLLEGKSKEIRELQSYADKDKQKISLLNKKLKALGLANRKAKNPALQDPDESLLVEPPVELPPNAPSSTHNLKHTLRELQDKCENSEVPEVPLKRRKVTPACT